jgi:hypothetical protein
LTELLWLDTALLTAGAIVAVLDIDFQWGRYKAGRPVYGVLVLAGLFAVYVHVVRSGSVPVPGWPVMVCAFGYLPFLSSRFIDLDTTDLLAREALESLLLERNFSQLRFASAEGVFRVGKRRFRFHWESREERDGIVIELDVHPSLLPVTISRPHVALVRDPIHLERLREDIRRRRGHPSS